MAAQLRALTAAAALFGPAGIVGFPLALVGAWTGAAISLVAIYRHLLYYSVPKLQRSVVRILLIGPLYAALSLLGLIIPNEGFHVILSVPKELWEAVVVYCFLALVLEYCGGENGCAAVIQTDPGHIDVPYCQRWLPGENSCWAPALLRRRIILSPSFVKSCKRSTLQFVALKPVATLLSLLVFSSGNGWVLTEQPWMWAHAVAYNISYCIALHALSLFYLATKRHPGLEGARPLRKFAAVKVIVFATFWQGGLLRLCFNLDYRWNLFLLCVELPLITGLQAWAFPVTEYAQATRFTKGGCLPVNTRDPAVDIDDAIAEELRDVDHPPPPPPPEGVEATLANLWHGVSRVTQSRQPLQQLQSEIAAFQNSSEFTVACKNAVDVASVRDVLEDAVMNFHRRYAHHSILQPAESVESRPPPPPPPPPRASSPPPQ